jgi:hypothetical protein
MTPREAREALWRRLAEAGCASGDPPVDAQDLGVASPWYIRLMFVAAGWLAAGCLFAFFVLGFDLTWNIFSHADRSEEAALGVLLGLLVCAASVALYRRGGRNAFARQFAFALSLAGTGLVAWSMVMDTRFLREDDLFLSIGCLLALLFAVIPDFTHRVWASGAGSAALACGVLLHRYHGFPPAEMLWLAGLFCLAMTGLWLAASKYPRQNALLCGGAYGLTLAFLAFAAWANFMPGFRHAGFVSVYAWAVCGGLAFLWAALVLLKQEGVDFRARSGAALLSLALLLALINLKLTCLAPCLILLLLGYGQGNRVLTGLGVVALLAYLNFYYYTLAATLLQKSLYMAAAGAALLAARFVLLRLWPEDAAEEVQEARHA